MRSYFHYGKINNEPFESYVDREIVTKGIDTESAIGVQLSLVPEVCLALWTVNFSYSSRDQETPRFDVPILCTVPDCPCVSFIA